MKTLVSCWLHRTVDTETLGITPHLFGAGPAPTSKDSLFYKLYFKWYFPLSLKFKQIFGTFILRSSSILYLIEYGLCDLLSLTTVHYLYSCAFKHPCLLE